MHEHTQSWVRHFTPVVMTLGKQWHRIMSLNPAQAIWWDPVTKITAEQQKPLCMTLDSPVQNRKPSSSLWRLRWRDLFISRYSLLFTLNGWLTLFHNSLWSFYSRWHLVSAPSLWEIAAGSHLPFLDDSCLSAGNKHRYIIEQPDFSCVHFLVHVDHIIHERTCNPC